MFALSAFGNPMLELPPQVCRDGSGFVADDQDISSVIMRPAEHYYCTEIGDGSSRRPWHLEEISESGARLRVDVSDDVPDRFTLLLKGDVVRVRTCQVVWRSASHIGVEFANSAPIRDKDCG